MTGAVVVDISMPLDGFVAGTWQIERDRGRANLLVRPLVTLSKRVRMLEQAEQP